MLCVACEPCAPSVRSSASRCMRSASAIRRSASARIRCSSSWISPTFARTRSSAASGPSYPGGAPVGIAAGESPAATGETGWAGSGGAACAAGGCGMGAEGCGGRGGEVGWAWPPSCNCSRSLAARASVSWRSAFAASLRALRLSARPPPVERRPPRFASRSSLRRFASAWRRLRCSRRAARCCSRASLRLSLAFKGGPLPGSGPEPTAGISAVWVDEGAGGLAGGGSGVGGGVGIIAGSVVACFFVLSLLRRWVTLTISRRSRIAATRPATKYWTLSLTKLPALLGKDSALASAGRASASAARATADQSREILVRIVPEATSSCP